MPKSKKVTKKVAAPVPPTKRSKVQPPTPASAQQAAPAGRDPRLPPSGTVLKKTHKGTEYEIKVLESTFEYAGKTYTSLSKIANEITGTSWNGFAWLGLTSRPRTTPAPQAEVKP